MAEMTYGREEQEQLVEHEQEKYKSVYSVVTYSMC